MINELIETKAYHKLLTDLATLLQQGQQKALNNLNEIRVATYWQIGKRLAKEKEVVDPEHESGFISRLANDLNMESSLLYRILQFYRTWPNGIPKTEDANVLSWAHFTELLAIKDPKERNYYFKQSSQQDWSRNTLRKAIQNDLFIVSKQPKKKRPEKTLKRDLNPLYVYKAVVEKVVDGDTLEVRIDLGFNVWVSQRIRFRGINTSEIIKHGVPAGEAPGRGEKAKAFVEAKLKGIEFIVIKTYKTDMYGRYVADVCYHPTIKKKEDVYTKGFYLNEEILTAGLAELVII